jgi:hypothetical protein
MVCNRSQEEDVPPPMESIAGFLYSPTTDIPFGKHIRLGQKDQLIFQSSVERGYQTGVIAHLKFLEANGFDDPIMLDDKQFTMVIEHMLPEELSLYDRGLWRSHFIVGWTSVYLGIAGEMEADEFS